MSDQTSPGSSSVVIERETISRRRIEGRGPYGGATFNRCEFESCVVGLSTSPADRTVLRDIKLIRCSTRGITFGPAIIEDVVVDGLKTYSLLQIWAPVLRHVTIRGRIGRLMISDLHDTTASAAQVSAFQQDNASLYRSVDWALDITEADFEEADLRGVPGHLVRRDPETQVIVRRERILDGRWRDLEHLPARWQVALELLLKTGMPSEVFVAGRRERTFSELVKGLRLLQSEGIAEPD